MTWPIQFGTKNCICSSNVSIDQDNVGLAKDNTLIDLHKLRVIQFYEPLTTTPKYVIILGPRYIDTNGTKLVSLQNAIWIATKIRAISLQYSELPLNTASGYNAELVFYRAYGDWIVITFRYDGTNTYFEIIATNNGTSSTLVSIQVDPTVYHTIRADFHTQAVYKELYVWLDGNLIYHGQLRDRTNEGVDIFLRGHDSESYLKDLYVQYMI